MTPELLHHQAGPVRLAYMLEGRTERGLIVLVHGLGQQLIAWPASLVRTLVAEGYGVVRLDNRDVGKSDRLEGRPNLAWLQIRSQFGWTGKAPYRLDDMAQDLCSLIEYLAAGPVHLVGASMGGMICQIVAARHPFLVASLTSIMSSSGAPGLPKPRPEVLRHLLTPPRRQTHEALVAYQVRMWQLIGSPRYPSTTEALVQRVEAEIARGHPDAGGTERQMAAILASGSRVSLLRHIVRPTLVIHGDADPLVPLPAGRHVQQSIPGARIEVIEGMGHDFPEALVPRIAALIVRHVEAAAEREAPPPPPPLPSRPASAAFTSA